MSKKREKSFIRTTIIIYIITMIIVCFVCYFMKNMELWRVLISLFIILICSFLINTFNLIFFIKKK